MKWTLTSDELPNPEGHEIYLVTIAHFEPSYKGRFVTTTEYEARYDDRPPFWRGFTDDAGNRVVAWMPLPEPYKKKEETDE